LSDKIFLENRLKKVFGGCHMCKEVYERADDIVLFIQKVFEVCEECDKKYDFKCSLCGGEAHAHKNSYNGHYRGYCDKCGFSIIQ
jgi:hypothetical protein